MSQSNSAKFRTLVAADGMTIAPGAYDCITAKLIERAGFGAVYMTGAGTAASLGYPDFGLVTMTEMVENAGRIAGSVDIPLVADADTGYGNELNVIRTIREYERFGVAAIHMEDQDFPKKCGHLDDKTLIPLEAYVAKIRAAVHARRDPEFTIIARTDARAVEGFDAAIARANAALAAGADIAFVEAPQTLEEIAMVPKAVNGPCLLNVVRRGKTPDLPLNDAEAMGYKLAILPSMLLRNVIGSSEELLDQLKTTNVFPVPAKDISVREAFQRFGADEWDKMRDRFSEPDKANEAAE